jgi:hypothetical protein
VGTVAYALGIGPLVQLFMPVFAVPEAEVAVAEQPDPQLAAAPAG